MIRLHDHKRLARLRIELQTAEYLERGGVIRQVTAQDNFEARIPAKMTRRESVEFYRAFRQINTCGRL